MVTSFPTFAEYFEAVWGYPPHAWQADLAEQVLADRRWPDVIDVPTGAGKTACLDIAVYSLAADPAAFGRRIAFVVDRRLIVDQTVTRAMRLAELLNDAVGDDPSSAIGAVASRLAELSAPTGARRVALDVGRLRGGVGGSDVDAAQWQRWPDQPAVIVSTVDQIGSRLLFRGYGVGSRMQPIHAGLTGNDCLVLLDEVHISAPLAETLTDLAEAFDSVREPLPRRWQFVQMSATPIGDPPRRFSLEPRHVEPGSDLARVVAARKLARLVAIGKPRQPQAEAWADNIGKLVQQLHVEQGVVGVVVNRVASARSIAASLSAAGEDVAMLTGRMRPHERVDAERRARQWADPQRDDADAKRVFVVATQSIEVGADLSFDGLITEASPYSSLRQRFGRLDRRGRRSAAGTPAPALIVGVASALAQGPDPVYGNAMKAMWDALKDTFGEHQFDVGPRSTEFAGFSDDVDVAVRHAAVLMPAHLDLLSMTNPAPPTSPQITPFLRGFEAGEPDVSILWRGDVSCTPTSQAVDRALLASVPPSPREMVAVPRSAAIQWLTAGAPADVADVDQAADPGDESGPGDRRVLRWRSGEQAELIDPRSISPGDVLIVPAEYGGLASGAWAPEHVGPVDDIAGPAWSRDGWLVVRPAVDLPDISRPSQPSAEELDEFKEALRARVNEPDGDPWWAGAQVDRLADIGSDEQSTWIIAGPKPSNAATLDGSDEANSAVGTPKPITLASHTAAVGALAEAMALRCFLPADLAADLRLAGELHDLGKADPRFQTMLHGDEIKALSAAEPLAKSVHRHWRFRGGYPEGMRHEYASAELVASVGDLLAPAHDPDLVMHLVTTHHGHARALPQLVSDPNPQLIEIEVDGHRLRARSTLDSGAVGVDSVERFSRLIERYGWHGLAWLETLLRLADHRRSEEESRGTAS